MSAAVLSVPVLLALSGCSSWICTDTTAPRGEAAAKVRVRDVYGQSSGVTAEVVDWRLEPHPQVPHEGDRVRFRFRFDGADEYSGPALDVCAVDEDRVVLGCQEVHAYQAFGPGRVPVGDDWLAVEHPERVTEVLLIPNDRSHTGRSCEHDPKDGGGTHPPESPRRGDRL
ncbi:MULTISPECIES: hypothetical protein [unclassified Streptomyces]|uniref:hypothetical protein n=1 Tax=unclassified Streptomyces TaxID=2593676 RepID=UPI0035D988BD